MTTYDYLGGGLTVRDSLVDPIQSLGENYLSDSNFSVQAGEFVSVYNLVGLIGTVDGQRLYASSFYNNQDDLPGNAGGGYFTWKSSALRSTHDGVTIISPTVPWNGTQATLSAFHAGTGESDPSGTGCWVRQYAKLSVAMGGAVGDGVTSDLVAFQAVIDATPDTELQVIHVPAGSYSGNFSSLTFGNRRIIWIEDGDVTYVNNAPAGIRQVAGVVGASVPFASDTISGFNASGIAEGTPILFKGASAVDDGAQGLFEYSESSAETVNDGTVFSVAGGGRVLRYGRSTSTKGRVNVKWFGAKGDHLDYTTAFLKAIATGHDVEMPSGDYILSGSLLLSADQTLFGTGYSTYLQWMGGDFPVIAHANYATIDSPGSNNIMLRDFRIYDQNTTSRANNWTVNLTNGNECYMHNVTIDGRLAATNTDKFGVAMGRAVGSAYSGFAWTNRITNCYLRRSKILIDSTDNTIEHNFIYPFGRDYGLQVGGGNVITGNHLSGGDTYGAIYINSPSGATMYATKIVGNQFDGGLESLNTKQSIFGTQLITSALIVGNHGFLFNAEFCRLENAKSCLIANNVIRDYDSDDTGEDDIYVVGYSNIIGPNTHTRALPAFKKGGGSRVNPAFPVRSFLANGSENNLVIPGTVTDHTTYLYKSVSFINDSAKSNLNTKNRLEDSFHGASLSNRWRTSLGTHGSCAAALQDTTNGHLRLTFGADAAGTMAANGAQLSSGLHWKAISRNLIFEAKIKLSQIIDIAVFVGLTDQYSALEMPFTLAAGDVLTANATDAVGFIFDTAADNDNIWLVGVANGVAATKQNSALAYTALTERTLRIELRNGGAARFFIDGTLIGTLMAGAVTNSVLLTPVIAGFTRTGVSKYVECDYVIVDSDI